MVRYPFASHTRRTKWYVLISLVVGLLSCFGELMPQDNDQQRFNYWSIIWRLVLWNSLLIYGFFRLAMLCQSRAKLEWAKRLYSCSLWGTLHILYFRSFATSTFILIVCTRSLIKLLLKTGASSVNLWWLFSRFCSMHRALLYPWLFLLSHTSNWNYGPTSYRLSMLSDVALSSGGKTQP